MTTTTAAAAPDVRTRRSAFAAVMDRPLTSYYIVLGAATFLLVLGLVMVLSASSVTAYAHSGSSFTIFRRQAMWVAFGVPVMWIASRLPVRAYRALSYPALIVAIGLLCLVLVPGIGVSVNGNQNWIDFGGPFRLQPSEAAKLALVLWGADLLTRKQRRLGELKHLLIPLLPVSGVIIGLVLAGGDLGTALILVAILMALLFVAGAPARLFVVLGSFGLRGIAILPLTRASRMPRFGS